jgi:Tfp pilus assembly protein PilZ
MKDSKASLVVLGSLSSDAIAAVGDAAAELDSPIRFVRHATQLHGALAKAEARVVVFDGSPETARDACDALRGGGATERVVLIAMTRERSDIAFLEMYQWGVDDLVDVDARSLSRRLRALAAAGRPPAMAVRPRVVVAAPPSRWRMVVARSLTNAGIDARLVESAEEAIANSDGATFVLAADDLAPSGAVEALAAARLGGSNALWVIAAAAKRVHDIERALRGFQGVACIDALTPPDDVVFVGNELASSAPTELRTSPRVSFGTTVAFRAAGRDGDEVGFSYNVSAGGMYVRTLAPLDIGDEVWLELHPPRSDRRVRLMGKVAWRRGFGRVDTATAPPGFGVRVTCGMGDDRARYERSVAALVDSSTRGRRAPNTGVLPSARSSAIV